MLSILTCMILNLVENSDSKVHIDRDCFLDQAFFKWKEKLTLATSSNAETNVERSNGHLLYELFN